MSTRRRNGLNNGMSKTLRDYLVPIIWLFLVILLIFSFFSGGWDNDLSDTIKYENQVPLNIMLDTDITEAYVIYPWENKVQMEGDKEIYKWEKIWVKEWSVSINFLSVWDFKLNKLWELLYSEDWELYLNSSDLFINSNTDLIINMKYAKVLIWKNSTVSLSQNEMSSNVSLLSWNVEVRNLSWESSVLAKWQMISISRLEANSDDVDLSMNKTEIDDFFKSSDWFIKNNWAFYLSRSDIDEEETQTGSILINKTNNSLISFENLTDESYVSSNMLNISWKYSDEDITSISVNWIEASLDSNTKTFNFKNISVSDFENDLVFKIYDDSNDLLEKFVYVVYYKSSTSNSNSVFQVVNYNVDWSQFTFTEPSSSSTFTTTSSFVTIRWLVNVKWIDKVSVNEFVLSSFNWSTWRYHADVKYNNLQDWTNVYTVKYYDANWKIVYTNNYTIIKKPIQVEVPEVKDTQTYSDEVSVN